MSTTTEKPTAPGRRVPLRVLVGIGLAVSLVLAVVVSLFASASPDGLEHVAETLGSQAEIREWRRRYARS